MLAEEAESLGVILGKLGNKLLQLGHGLPLLGWVCVGTAGSRTGPTNFNKVIVLSKRHQRLWKLPHVELYYAGDNIGVDVGKVDQLCSVFKSLTELFYFALDPADSVDSLDVCAAGIDDRHTFL